MADAIQPEQYAFPTTGATWSVDESGFVHLKLGGTRPSDDDQNNEAAWAAEQFVRLKERYPDHHWRALVNLVDVPESSRPPQRMREIYSEILRDEMTEKVAILHASPVQQAIINIAFLISFLPDKIHFFANEEAARDWLQTAHPHAEHVNW